MLRYRSARAPLHLQCDCEGPGFLQQLQEVSVAEQDAVVRVKDMRESSRAQWRFCRLFEPQRLEGILAVDREPHPVCVRLHIGRRRWRRGATRKFIRDAVVVSFSTQFTYQIEDSFCERRRSSLLRGRR